MRRQLSLILTLTAWLLATGSHWDLVQTFAWGRMLATNAQSMSWVAAAQRTFSPEGMCSLCETVAAARQQQDAADAKVPGAKTSSKIFMVSAPAALVFVSPAPACVGLTAAVPALTSAERAAPPLPPPRVRV